MNKKLNANVINWFQTQKDRTNSNNGTIKGLSFIQMRIEANQNKQIIFIFWLFIWFCWYYLFKKQSWWQILLQDVHPLFKSFTIISYFHIYEKRSLKNICNEITILTESMIKVKISNNSKKKEFLLKNRINSYT